MSDPLALYVVAAGLVPFALGLAVVGLRRGIDARLVVAAIVADLGWVVGSGILVVGFPSVLSASGRAVVTTVAVVVAAFAGLQVAGLRRLVGDNGRELSCARHEAPGA